ncbi:hypothetical protein P20652_1823 [Pseudoalteromonas sp. BSi20652]|nr:hypothetical protein P20652_1823 [Pseudoalteromonas sp. BSi20652]
MVNQKGRYLMITTFFIGVKKPLTFASKRLLNLNQYLY